VASQPLQLPHESKACNPANSSAAPKTRLLRLSVTDRCNFRCRYCMPAEGVPKFSKRELLSLEQLSQMVRWLSGHMLIERVKITGGEPLVRLGLEHLIADLCAIPKVREVSLTTNGSLLARKAWELKANGLARVNVSVDSLDPERFAELTRGGQLRDTLEGIDAALKVGLTPLKLNTVLRRSTWKTDVPKLLDFASERGLEPRFIELMRTRTGREWCDSEFVAMDGVREWLEQQTPMVPVASPEAIPAQLTRIRWAGKWMLVGWIAPRSHPFCGTCERVRLDSKGRLRRCLMDSAMLDLVRLRRAAGDDGAVGALYGYMAGKHAPHGMDSEFTMSQLGG